MAVGVGRHRDEPVGGDGLGLPLQLERFDGLDLDRVLHDQAVGRAPSSTCPVGGLLEPGGDVHRVARDQTLPGRRVAPTTSPVFTPMRAGADAVVALELGVEPARPACMPAAARTARSGSSSCSAGCRTRPSRRRR